MTFYIENETEYAFPFPVQEIFESVCKAVLASEGCEYEAEVSLTITDNTGIREINREFRGIDRETDVLSFPNVDFEIPGKFEMDEEHEADYFNPDSGELLLGDIMISVDRMLEQAQNYGHSEKREFAFLVAHSMLHLCGYDHMAPDEAKVMEEKQEAILQSLGITRDI